MVGGTLFANNFILVLVLGSVVGDSLSLVEVLGSVAGCRMVGMEAFNGLSRILDPAGVAIPTFFLLKCLSYSEWGDIEGGH